MAVVELSVLAVLAAVQTCVRGTARQEDRTGGEQRRQSARPARQQGVRSQGQPGSRGRFELEGKREFTRLVTRKSHGLDWLSKVHQ